MIRNKQTGSYYTPAHLSNFIVRYLNKHIHNNVSILEPSVGDGSFVQAINDVLTNNTNLALTILDINASELNKAAQKASNNIFNSVNKIHDDYLNFYSYCNDKFSLIIGNPPYIKANLLTQKQIDLCKMIHSDALLSDKKINNIWTSFVISANKFLEDNGILCYVLPTDLLQVKYSEEIRHFLESHFQRIEIFTLDRNIFSDIEQHTIILIAYKKAKSKGTFFYQINDFEKNKYEKISSNGLMLYESKWTHYILEPHEIQLLNLINAKLPRIDEFVISKPGIVTGANDYFILNDETVKQYKLEKYVKPIVQKSLYIKQNIELTQSSINDLIVNKKPVYILILNDQTEIDDNLKLYFDKGIDRRINQRYKCRIRNNWYCIPNISTESDGFIFKRYHKVPKILKNTAKVHVTDSAYKILMKNNYELESFIYSFFNIITLIFAELTGRKYGGGVMELIPTEFRNLPIYYHQIDSKKFNKFNISFNAHGILNNDQIFTFLGLTNNEINMLKKIYSKLLLERLCTLK